jgi:hypothetical protein
VTSCHILAFQASVTSPQALCARISWGPKKITKNISVFQSKLENIDTNYILDDKSIELLLEDYNILKNNL